MSSLETVEQRCLRVPEARSPKLRHLQGQAPFSGTREGPFLPVPVPGGI